MRNTSSICKARRRNRPRNNTRGIGAQATRRFCASITGQACPFHAKPCRLRENYFFPSSTHTMRTQSLDKFCAWIEQTSLSQTIQVTSWFVPTVQTVHILAVAAVMASIFMIDLRLLGIVGRDQPLARVSARYRPIIWWTLPVLLITGILMITGAPATGRNDSIFQHSHRRAVRWRNVRCRPLGPRRAAAGAICVGGECARGFRRGCVARNRRASRARAFDP